MKKTEIIYTRITKPNKEFLRRVTRRADISRATCLDDMLSFMRENMSQEQIQKELAKRRNEIWKTGKHIPGYAS